MTILTLRDYQGAAIEATRRAWSRGVRRPAVVMPTGTGKTVVFAHLVSIMRAAGVRSLILAHRDELIEQAAAKVRAVAPDLRVGIYKADRREVRGRDVVVASVQSLRGPVRRAEIAAAGFRLVIVDEAHHAVADTYMAVLRALGCFEEDLGIGAYALGVTATMGRTDRVALGQAWQEIVHTDDILDMIRKGYLVNAKGIRVRVEGLDLRGVARSGGDWRDGSLAEAMHDALAPAAIARAYVQHAKDRPGVLFSPGVAMAYEMAEALTAEGIPAEGIDGAMQIRERRRVLADHARGDVQVVCNAMVLTEGWDAPHVSAVVIARPTSSTPLYVQMAGRGLRPHPGKRDCLIIDVAGVTGRHRLASVIDLAGAERVESLPDELAIYDEEIDLLDLLAEPTGVGGGRPDEDRVDGPLVHEIVDLFGTRRQAWLRTPRGVWFLSVSGDRLVFLAPESDPGLYAVARCHMSTPGGEYLQRGLDLSMAMSWGEQYAAEGTTGTVLTRKGAAWRKAEPSQGQLNMARRLGLVGIDIMDRGQLSDLISTSLATQRIDAMPCVSTVHEGGYW